jgi:putative ubiquitin-RnfH superfamily antitoxin RatB of RatAB toxin-antitoxin module
VVVDTTLGPRLCPLELPAGATIADALGAAQAQLGVAGVDWGKAVTGVWGLRQDRHTVPGEGDRIEVYRALTGDPRQRRRQRVRKAPR